MPISAPRPAPQLRGVSRGAAGGPRGLGAQPSVGAAAAGTGAGAARRVGAGGGRRAPACAAAPAAAQPARRGAAHGGHGPHHAHLEIRGAPSRAARSLWRSAGAPAAAPASPPACSAPTRPLQTAARRSPSLVPVTLVAPRCGGPQADSGLWMSESSLGDAGASCLGYFGGVWAPDGAGILAHGFTGAAPRRGRGRRRRQGARRRSGGVPLIPDTAPRGPAVPGRRAAPVASRRARCCQRPTRPTRPTRDCARGLAVVWLGWLAAGPRTGRALWAGGGLRVGRGRRLRAERVGGPDGAPARSRAGRRRARGRRRRAGALVRGGACAGGRRPARGTARGCAARCTCKCASWRCRLHVPPPARHAATATDPRP
jgi:hypothetical protein